MNTDGLDLTILGPAFLAGLAVLATHVPLGREVLRRGIIFLDLAVAQIAGLGVIAANALLNDAPTGAAQIFALSAALAGALLLSACEKRWPDVQEAIIGSAFVLAASLGLLLLARHPEGGTHLKDLLAGQILWVDLDQVLVAAAVAIGVIGGWIIARTRRGRPRITVFYLLFAIAITTSVQIVGVYLVFASLVIPALAVRRFQRGATAWAFGIGVSGYALGLALSGLVDAPAGPLIVLCLAAFGILARLGGREEVGTRYGVNPITRARQPPGPHARPSARPAVDEQGSP
ncbi:MAG: metal ABC transporter permease [Pseudomonadota bacterium]